MNNNVMQRSLGKCLLFTFITCGIYSIYWVYTELNDLYYMSGRESENASRDIIFIFITCGIYYFFVWAKMSNMIDEIKTKNNLPASNNTVLFIVLHLFGLALVNLCIVQSNINSLSNINTPDDDTKTFSIEDKDL